MKEGATVSHRTATILWLLLPSSFILHPSSFAKADGGAVRLRGRAGGYEVAVFTSPTPLRAGPVDVSVLVQDAATRACVPDVRVSVRLTGPGAGDPLEYPATEEAATNKLLRAAVFQLPEPGEWDIEVAIEGPRGPALVRFRVQAEEPLPRWRDLWPWFCWPALIVALFAVHRMRARRYGPVSSAGAHS
jgi:hypothetical protein